MRKVLERCPSCSGELIVTEMSCTHCDTVIKASYTLTPFAQLSPEDLEFLEIFIKNRGNVKEMERELAVSYWAIRSRLNEIIEAMGLDAEPDPGPGPEATSQRRAILEQLEQGQITAVEATQLLANLKKI